MTTTATAKRCRANTNELGGHRWHSGGWEDDAARGWCDVLVCAVCSETLLFEVNAHTRDYIERREAEGWAEMDDDEPQADEPAVIEQMSVPSREEIEAWGEGSWVRLWMPPYVPANPDGVVYEFVRASYHR